MPKAKMALAMPRPLIHRFQYQKKLWGALKKIRRKEMFSPKSMTKLEALTVCTVLADRQVITSDPTSNDL